MKMKPMGDQLLLKAKESKEKTYKGIILAASTSAYGYAEVIAVGPGLFTQTGDRIPMTCKIGDVVLLHGRLLKGDNEVKFEDTTYILVRESEISMVESHG